MARLRRFLFAAVGLTACLLLPLAVSAQTKPVDSYVIPGNNYPAGTNGCPSTNNCFVPYSGGLPLPVGAGGYTFAPPAAIATIALQNASYVSGNCMGGFQAIAVGTTAGVTGTLVNLGLISSAGLVTAKQVYIFDQNPSGSTCTDKSTFTIAAADLPKLIGTYSLVPVVPTGGAASQALAADIVLQFATSGNANIYIAVVETATETPAAASTLIVQLGGIKDAP